MVGRSGSSMVSGIFKEHGVWVGPSKDGDGRNPKGYFENQKLKRVLREEFGKCFFTEAKFKSGWRKKVEKIIFDQGYREGPWMYKHGATFHKVWKEFDPKIVKVWRETEQIFQSFKRSGMMANYTDKQIKDSIKLHHEIMANIPGFDVDSDKLIEGDYRSIKDAITGCGLEYSEQIVRDFIVPEWYAQN